MRDFIQEAITWAHRPSDFNEHMSTVMALHYAVLQFQDKAPDVIEFGTGYGQSTRAFLSAMQMHGGGTLRSYDIIVHDGVPELFADAQEAGLDAEYLIQSTLEAQIEPCDILLVDSHHTYQQVSGELRDDVVDKVSTYIVFHDITLYGLSGQDPGSVGIWPAINEFLERKPEWKIKDQYENNNGLLVCVREVNHDC